MGAELQKALESDGLLGLKMKYENEILLKDP
jgi:hypothetical protein